jgi:hypothetical protein
MKSLPNKVTGDQLTAADWTNHKNELQNIVVRSGQSFDSGSETQAAKAAMIHAMGGMTFIDSGSANTVELTPATGTSGLLLTTQYSEMEGARVKFEVIATNTGATTLNIGQDTGSLLGTKKLFNSLKTDIGAGDLVAGKQYEAYFDTSLDAAAGAWVLTNWSEVTTQNFNNAIINPRMEINQRSLPIVSIANDQYSMDKYIYRKSGAVVHDADKVTDVPNSTLKTSLELDVTTADTSIAAGDYCLISQYIEGYNFIPFVGRTATLSFWVKDTKTGIHCVSFSNDGEDRSYVAEYTINTTNTWEFKEITLTFNYSGGTWLFETGLGLRINWCLAAGSTFQTTADAWQTGQYFATSNQVNAVDSTSNNFLITGIQLELGSSATDLEYRLFEIEEALCQRYFLRVSNSGATGIWWGTGQFIDTTRCDLIIPFPTKMRALPSGSASSGFQIFVNATTNSATISFPALSRDLARVRGTVTGPFTAGDAGSLANSTTNSWLDFSAELT